VLSWGGECLALYIILLDLGAPPELGLLNQATFALAVGCLVGSASLLPGGIGAAEGTVAAVLDLVAGLPRDVAGRRDPAHPLARYGSVWRSARSVARRRGAFGVGQQRIPAATRFGQVHVSPLEGCPRRHWNINF
jgi:uncharacterized membrane protein YbhN (UPF0104 family)